MFDRFHVDNEQYVAMKWHALQAGNAGEARLQQFFDKYGLAEEALFDISLQANSKFQIDCLLITPQFALIIESKNITGDLAFEERPARLVRTRDGVMTTFESPETQLQRNILLLENWLHTRHHPLPVIGVIVWTTSTYPNILKSPKHCDVLFLSSLPTFIAQQRLRYHAVMTIEQCEKLKELIVLDNEVYKFPHYSLFPRWKVNVYEVRSGVRCACGFRKMQRQKQRWYCPSCHRTCKDAHIATLREWFTFY